MGTSRRTSDEDTLRRIVREEIRAGLREMLPVSVLLLTYKEAAKWISGRRPFGDDRKPVRAALVRQWVELGLIPAVQFGEQEPRIAAADLEWDRMWLRHTRDENDRDWSDKQTADRLAAQEKRHRPRTSRTRQT